MCICAGDPDKHAKKEKRVNLGPGELAQSIASLLLNHKVPRWTINSNITKRMKMLGVMTHGCDLSTVDAKTDGSMGLNVLVTNFRSARDHLKQGCM